MEQSKCIRVFADKVQIAECKKKIQASNLTISRVSNVLELAGNEVRLKILYLLQEENEMCPCDLSDILEMSIPAISQHLRKLKDGNLIASRRDAQTIYYSLKEEHIKMIKSFLSYIHQQQVKPQMI